MSWWDIDLGSEGAVCVALAIAPLWACSTQGGLCVIQTRSLSTDGKSFNWWAKRGRAWRGASSSGRGKHSPRKHQIPEKCPALVEKIQFGLRFKQTSEELQTLRLGSSTQTALASSSYSTAASKAKSLFTAWRSWNIVEKTNLSWQLGFITTLGLKLEANWRGFQHGGLTAFCGPHVSPPGWGWGEPGSQICERLLFGEHHSHLPRP